MSFACVFVHNTLSHGGRASRSSTLLAGMLSAGEATGEKQSVPEAREAPCCDRREFTRPGVSQQVQRPSDMPTGDNPSASLQDQWRAGRFPRNLLTGLGFRCFSGPILCLLKRLHQFHSQKNSPNKTYLEERNGGRYSNATCQSWALNTL